MNTVGKDVLFFEKDNHGEGFHCKTPIILSTGNEIITSMAMSADGRTVVTGGEHGVVVVWKKNEENWESIDIVIIQKRSQPSPYQTVVCISHVLLETIQWFARSMTVVHGAHRLYMSTVAVSAVQQATAGFFMVIGKFDGGFCLRPENHNGWKEEYIGSELSTSSGSFAISEDKNAIVVGVGEDIEVFERGRGSEEWTQRVLKGHGYPANTISIHPEKEKVVTGSISDQTVRVWDMGARQWLPAEAPECDTDYVFDMAVGEKRVVYSNAFHGTLSVLSLVDGSWERSTIQVDGELSDIQIDESGQRLRVGSTEGNAGRLFIEENGNWKNIGDRTPGVIWNESVPLQEEQWPLGLSALRSHWDCIYEVPGGEWFAVCLQNEPYFDMVQLVRRP